MRVAATQTGRQASNGGWGAAQVARRLSRAPRRLLGALAGLSLCAFPAPAAESRPRERIEAVATAVNDGDSVRVALRWVRLAGIDAPETAPRNRAWAEQPGALPSREALADLALGRRVSCEMIDTDLYGRAVARCARGDDGLDLSAEMVRLGHAWADPAHRGRPLLPAERAARDAGLGLWAAGSPPPVPPWCWRRPASRRCAGTVADHGHGG